MVGLILRLFVMHPPFVPAICFAFIAINGMVSSELREKLVMSKMHFKSMALIGSMIMLYVSLYNGRDAIEYN